MQTCQQQAAMLFWYVGPCTVVGLPGHLGSIVPAPPPHCAPQQWSSHEPARGCEQQQGVTHLSFYATVPACCPSHVLSQRCAAVCNNTATQHGMHVKPAALAARVCVLSCRVSYCCVVVVVHDSQGVRGSRVIRQQVIQSFIVDLQVRHLNSRGVHGYGDCAKLRELTRECCKIASYAKQP